MRKEEFEPVNNVKVDRADTASSVNVKNLNADWNDVNAIKFNF